MGALRDKKAEIPWGGQRSTEYKTEDNSSLNGSLSKTMDALKLSVAFYPAIAILGMYGSILTKYWDKNLKNVGTDVYHTFVYNRKEKNKCLEKIKYHY